MQFMRCSHRHMHVLIILCFTKCNTFQMFQNQFESQCHPANSIFRMLLNRFCMNELFIDVILHKDNCQCSACVWFKFEIRSRHFNILLSLAFLFINIPTHMWFWSMWLSKAVFNKLYITHQKVQSGREREKIELDLNSSPPHKRLKFNTISQPFNVYVYVYGFGLHPKIWYTDSI